MKTERFDLILKGGTQVPLALGASVFVVGLLAVIKAGHKR